MKIDWASTDNLVLANPRLPEKDSALLHEILREPAQALKSHVFILTSGTSASSAAGFKWVALSKESVLSAAGAANKHLQSTREDLWLHSLPDFHIGGLSIWARAELSGAKVAKASSAAWNPQAFVKEALETGATLCSLVPTQVHDLVRVGLHAPSRLRAILLGGGASSRELILRARELGWNVLPTYGMTETSSQIATATLGGSPDLTVLPHLEVSPERSNDADQRLCVRGSSLLTGYITQEGFVDPKRGGWFLTEDFGKVEGGVLTILGRISERIKIGGETVHLGRLESFLEEEAARLEVASQITLFAAPDERLESVLHLVREERCDPVRAQAVADQYNRRVLPFEKIRAIRSIPAIPRTELGKIKRAELRSLLCVPAPSP